MVMKFSANGQFPQIFGQFSGLYTTRESYANEGDSIYLTVYI